ncbi:MAG: DEAD/DEAH box helicase family protein [Thermoprotei archaeon]
MEGATKLPAFIRKNSLVPREYQLNIYRNAIKKNTLVVLPTGLGKTVIAALVAAKRFEEYPDEKVVVLAPTRPLAEQHASTFKRFIEIADSEVLTGETSPEIRKWKWNHSQFVFMTPQALENDLRSGRYDLSGVSLMVFDEAHHAVGDYPYVFIASKYVEQASHPLVLGLTASPGYSKEHLEEILSNLHIERVEARDETSPDVAAYVKEITEKRVVLDLPPELLSIGDAFDEISEKYIDRLSALGIRFRVREVPVKYLLDVQEGLRRKIESGSADSTDFQAYGFLNNVIRVKHAKLLLEVEGVSSALSYMDEMEDEVLQGGGTRSLKMLINDKKWIEAKGRLKALRESGMEHPKVPALLSVVSEELSNPNSKILVFTHYRETARVLSSILEGVKGARPAPFLGQAKKGDEKGMSQRDQMRVLEDFRSGLINVLVATQVAEEGLDVENCDLVIFYDNVPSAIRLIQRRGRTGRKKEGKIIVLIAKGTADETYHWISLRRRGTMGRLISSQERYLSGGPEALSQAFKDKKTKINKGLLAFTEELTSEAVILDHRLEGSKLSQALRGLGVGYSLKDLGGSYVKVKDVVVRVLSSSEVPGLLSSGGLFEEAIFMKTIGKPIFIVEGIPPLLNTEEAGPRSALLSISVKYGVPFLPSSGPQDSASYIAAWALRNE